TPGGAISVIPARTGTDPEFVYFQVRSFQEFEVKVRTEKCEILPSLYINEPVVEVELNLGMKVGDTGLGSKTTITKQLGDGIDGTHDGLTVLASGDILTNKSAQFSANRKIVLKKFHAKPGSSFKATINDCHPTGWIDDIPVHASAEGQAIFDFHIPVNNTAYTLAAVGFTNAGIPIKIIRLDSDLAEEVVYEGLHNGVGLPTSLNKGFYRILAGLSTSSNLPYLTDYSTTGLQLSYQYPMGQLSYSFYNDVEDMVCTISPNGVQQLKEGVDYQDIDKSTWVFNVESQVINRADKDDGELQYVYSKNATERFKQNAQQKLDNRYAYVAYDKSGRLIETGEYRGTDYVFSLQPTVGNDVYDILESKSNTSTEINGLSRQFCFDATRSFYDRPANLPASVNRTQDYLMGQVSYTEYQPDPNESVTSRNYFSYDEFGRMVWLAQELEGLGVKVIDYEYDYFGNVTKVIYQKDVPEEAFYHQYTYNIDQRLVKVETSRDGVAWVTQAKYEYYLHGPLKRVELGDDGDELQGIDYAYTINGWLKSINNVDVSNDIGGDGKPGALPQDVFNLQLEYFMGDYRSAKQHNPIMAVDIAAGQVPEQFGGNIAVASWRTQKPLGVNEPTYGADSYAYWYDDNDQLTQARFGFLDGLDTYESYQDERYSLRDVTYDLNGNIKTLERLGRFGENAAPVHSFNYTYATNTNQLEEIIGYGEYEYNAIGQLVTQVDWENQNDNLYLNYNAHGKVTEVTSTNLSAKYAYDVGGFRYKKEVNGKETYYVRSGGSIVAVYQKDDNDELKLIELPIYGLNRIGVKTLNAYKEWEDRYELKDHLGNVRVVFREGKARNKNFFTSIEDGTLVNGQAATENEPLFEYEGNEGVIKSLAKAHTGNMSVVLDGDDPLTQRGPHIWLPVERGDDLFAEVYFQADELPENGGVSQPNGRVAGSSFVKNTSLLAVQSPQKGIVGESGQTLPSINLNLLAIPHVLNITSQRPVTTSTNTPTLNYYTAWVRMELYENKDDTEATDSKAAQITLMSDQTGQWKVASLFWEGIEMPDTWCSGYVKVYFENKGSIPIWFDDVSVEHIHNPPKVEVIAYTDYYPFGAKMRESCLKGVRFGYQGEYAEHDTETGWSNFELRLYDPIIGRWLSPDPYAQYWSPYLAMGNNPVNQIDPNGGFSDPIKKGDPTLNAAGTQRFGLNAFTDQMEWSDIFMGMDIIGERSFWDKVGGFFNKHAEAIQNTLDVIGMLEIPIVSQVADIASAGVSLAQGHYGEAAMGVLAALPIVGGAAAAGKRLLKLKRLKKAADGATDAGKVTAKNKEKLKFGGCFVQGTQVLTERGLVDIKKIVSNLGQRTTQSINHSFKAINLFYYSLISVLALVIFGRYYINIKK
ncbi:MAG: RHS repeat-associated core domain-containing protein, partial [Flammeovirgaceae bacterium]